MAEESEEVRVDASADVVWAVLSDFAAIARWGPNVEHSSMASAQADGVGAVRRVQVGRNALLERIVTWEPGRQLGYELEGLPPVVRKVTNTWTVTPDGSGSLVRLTTDIEAAGPRPPQRAAARVFGKVLARTSRPLVSGLAAHVDQLSGEEAA